MTRPSIASRGRSAGPAAVPGAGGPSAGAAEQEEAGADPRAGGSAGAPGAGPAEAAGRGGGPEAAGRGGGPEAAGRGGGPEAAGGGGDAGQAPALAVATAGRLISDPGPPGARVSARAGGGPPASHSPAGATTVTGRPALLRPPGPQRLAAPSPARPPASVPRPMSAGPATVILALLALAAVALTSVTIRLARVWLAAAEHPAPVSAWAPAVPAPAAPASARPGSLIRPAPAVAGGLPRRYRTITNPSILQVIATARQRFAALLPGAAGPHPAALYGEPGRADPVTGTTAWVLYLGYNLPARSPAQPAATAVRLLDGIGGSSRLNSWRVDPGPGGGAARCAVAVLSRTQVALCGWATARATAILVTPTRDTSVSELAAFLVAMRADLQPR